MSKVEIIRIPARLSHLGIDELYYEVEADDWHDRARRLQERRWNHVHAVTRNFHHLDVYRKDTL
jgi:hypothetical protein